jgi:hypothetical protein
MNAQNVIRGGGQEPLGYFLPGRRWEEAVKLAAKYHHTRTQNLSLWQILGCLRVG